MRVGPGWLQSNGGPSLDSVGAPAIQLANTPLPQCRGGRGNAIVKHAPALMRWEPHQSDCKGGPCPDEVGAALAQTRQRSVP